jgi:hypothetical protein
MKKLLVAGFLLAGFLGADAQITTTTLTSYGNLAGTLGGNQCTYVGSQAGRYFTGTTAATGGNTFIGQNSGNALTSGNSNTYTGYKSGIGSSSTSPLPGSPGYLVIGNSNSFYGASSGSINNGGNENAFFGALSGSRNATGSNNTYIGVNTGFRDAVGSGNVCLGYNAGYSAPGNPAGAAPVVNNQLYIDNSANATPLIWGDFAANQLKLNGAVGIGAVASFPVSPTSPFINYKLFVTGGIVSDEMTVKLSASNAWADYVFAKDYSLKPLSEVEKFINTNGHLPNVPSAAEVKENGINVAEMAKIQQEKIEELTLYIIAQNKRIEALESKMSNK